MKSVLKVFVLVVLFHGTKLMGQQKVEFGLLSASEQAFTTYAKDTTAHAVYLYEKGENYFEIRGGYVWLIKKYHAKKKILDKQGMDEANITIPYYRSDKSKEIVKDIRALTHNGVVKHSLRKENVFDADVSERWSVKKFTFPDVKEGSILEYSYEIQSPFFFNLTGWKFQEAIPKIYTEYNAKIPGNYRYNRALIGEIALDVNEATIKKDCFSIPRATESADCEVLKYVMKDVPAFKEDESYMLSPSNYRSALEFELSELLRFDGTKERYTKTWKDVDKEFKTDNDIGRQLKKVNFFERNIPVDLISGSGTPLERAKRIYQFVKDHYVWDGDYGIFLDNRVKQAFDEHKGNIAEINITLINLLNAAGIDTDMMVLSTRDNGLPKKSHPVMSDFNYLIAKTEIDGTTYLLDATDKQLPFGMLPYRCLNYYGRVMDLEEESYWYDIVPIEPNMKTVRIEMSLDPENSLVSGNFQEITTGYEALFKRDRLASLSEDEYLDKIEDSSNGDIFIKSYELDSLQSDDRKLVEHFSFEMEGLDQNKNLFFNTFLVRFFESNPFMSETRNYPVDFGYLRSYMYYAKIKVPEGYKVKEIPKPINLGLPENSGIMRFNCSESQGQVMVQFSLQLRSTQYTSAGYAYVKEFFENAVTTQNNSYLVLEKE
ncbi:protein of unknown function [Flagellimonas taeanensis]|uniref:Uncharacterized protein n=1 Tax=Flagellimonas taeanensis TaxID=1005926 RepID=A0A1M6TTK7_9FLAO|nr:DUF3857 domain-containing protein [Allomuricauda taeanensis]SFB90449.1 protein of unknown function [Allomuricauda taeanensis]SHK60271.1 protein of unknown function [Allomuricauda taeanensis]